MIWVKELFYFYRANVILILPHLMNIERLENPFLSKSPKAQQYSKIYKY